MQTEVERADADATERALVVAGHGSHRNPDSAAPVHSVVERVRERDAFAEVRPAFWKEEPSLRTVLHTVDADEAVVVPLFVSEGYFVEQVLPREFGLGERDRGDDGPTVEYAAPVGTHPAMTDVIAARARRLLDGSTGGDSVSDADVALAVVGHGTERNPNSADAVYDHVEALRDREEFAAVGAAFMDEAPFVEDVPDRFDAAGIAVVPLFVADGFHTQDEIPELLGLTDDAGSGYPVPATAGDRRIWYASAVGTDPLVADVVLERAAESSAVAEADADAGAGAVLIGSRIATVAAADAGADANSGAEAESEANAEAAATTTATDADATDTASATDADATATATDATDTATASATDATAASRSVRSDAAVAFLDWVADAKADSGDAKADSGDAAAASEPDAAARRNWGELVATSTGNERYDLRHREDRGVPVGDLDRVAVADLREVIRYADDGRYRPFAGERSLPRGWVASSLDREGLLRAVATVYPASVEHWAAERAGDLDPVDFRAVADRQTGIYECVADCSREEVAGAIEACCGNCAKRREWDAGDESEGAECGEGAIPCREPCSFLVAAAREFHRHEQVGDERATDAEPTDAESTDDEPTDAQHPEPDPSVPRGDLTDPANLYRVRYRRARGREIEARRPETELRP